MKQPVCPYCSTPLELSVSCAVHWSRKIKKDGSIAKKILKNDRKPISGSTHLVCPECPFEYDCEHYGNITKFKELDNWIAEHLKELDNWK